MFTPNIYNIITKYTFKIFKCEILDNYPYLGSYGFRQGKGHIYRFDYNEINDGNLTENINGLKRNIKNKYNKIYGILDYHDGNYYIIKIAYDII